MPATACSGTGGGGAAATTGTVRYWAGLGWVGCELGLAPCTAEVDGGACLFQGMRRLIRHRHAADGILETFCGWWRGSLVDRVVFVAWVCLHALRRTPALLQRIRQVNLAPREAQMPNHPGYANAQTYAPGKVNAVLSAMPSFVLVAPPSCICMPASPFVPACI